MPYSISSMLRTRAKSWVRFFASIAARNVQIPAQDENPTGKDLGTQRILQSTKGCTGFSSKTPGGCSFIITSRCRIVQRSTITLYSVENRRKENAPRRNCSCFLKGCRAAFSAPKEHHVHFGGSSLWIGRRMLHEPKTCATTEKNTFCQAGDVFPPD